MSDAIVRIPDVVRWRDQLACFALAELHLEAAISLLLQDLGRFGPVHSERLTGMAEVIRFLSPVKSFPTRYAAVALGSWTAILADKRGATCDVNAYALSRLSGCRAIAVSALASRRELHVYEGGIAVREIQSLDDGDVWFYSQSGVPLAFESRGDGELRPKSERLRAELVRRYFEAFTQLSFPDWLGLTSAAAAGIARSVHEVKVPIHEFRTIDDLLSRQSPSEN
jgi:hypothetical protein